MKVYGYCRISTPQQNIERQERNIKAAYPDAIIIKESYVGTKVEEQKELDKLIKTVQSRDTIVFDSVSKMSRNAEDGWRLYEKLYNDGVELVFLKEPHINTEMYGQKIPTLDSNPTWTALSIVFGAVNDYIKTIRKKQFFIAFEQAEMEANNLHQRIKEDIEIARLNGKQIGRVVGSKLLVEKEIPALERNYRAIEQEQQHMVVKSNDLIRKTRYSLSAEEQKIILYALSKISKDDVDLHDMTFDVLEFSRLCGLEGKAYARIKDSLTKLQSKPFWIEMSNGVKTYVHWFSKVHMKHYSGKVTIKFHDDLAPYILQPKNGFTSFSIYPILAMESKYSIRLYEILKSYEAIGDWWFTVEDFQKKLDSNYTLFADLRRKVIDVSVKEINLYSDLDVSWQPVKEGRKVTKIQFHISHKPPFFEEQAKKHIKDELDIKNNSIEQKLYELIKTRNTLSTQQQKLLLLLMAQIQPNDDDFKEYEFSIKDYCILCDVVCGGKIYQDIWESIEDIAKIQIKDVRLSNGERTVLSWIENPCYIQGEGRITMMVNPYVKPILLELKKNFTQSELLNVLCMKSKYSIRLYELICSAHYHDQKAHSNYLTIEDIRELLGVPDGMYPEFKSLKARVLDVAVQEIEEYSDKRVTYTVDRRGRTPVGVKITIDTKPSVFTGFRDPHMTDEEAAGVNHFMDMMIAAKQQVMLRKALYNE